jgi:hypothetical protein
MSDLNSVEKWVCCPTNHDLLDHKEDCPICAGIGVVQMKDVPSLFDPDGHWGDFIKSAVLEAEKAMRKFPQPNYVITKIAEEAGEVVKAAVHCAEGRESLETVRGEMRQLVAMLYRLWMEGDGVHGLAPVSGVLLQAKDGN